MTCALRILLILGVIGMVCGFRLHGNDEFRDPCVELRMDTGSGNHLCPFVSTRIMSSAQDRNNQPCIYGLSIDVHPQKHRGPKASARYDGPLYVGTVFPVGDKLYQVDSIYQLPHRKSEGSAMARPLSEERRKEFPPSNPRAIHIPIKGSGGSTEIQQEVRVEHIFKTADSKIVAVELRLTKYLLKNAPTNVEVRLVRLRKGDTVVIEKTTFELGNIIAEDKERKVIGWVDLIPVEPETQKSAPEK